MPAPLNCLYVLNSAQIGGGNRSILALWLGIRALGVTPHAVCPGFGPMVDAVRATGVPCEIYDYQQPSLRDPVSTLRNYRTWRRLIQRADSSLVHANSIHAARSIALSSRRSGLKIVCHVRFDQSPESLTWALRGIPPPHAFIYNSHALQSKLVTLKAMVPKALHVVVHNAVDTNAFRPQPLAPDAPSRVGILANLMAVKGHEDFLRMAAILRWRFPTAEFWVIGDDIHGTGRRSHLEGLAASLDLGGSVKFLGHRDDVPALLRQLTVVVCASHAEPFGRCLIEAMACGRPVVATCVDGIPEVVQHGKTGYLVSPGDPAALAAKVAVLLSDRQEWERMSEAGANEAQARFSFEIHARKVYDVYHSLF